MENVRPTGDGGRLGYKIDRENIPPKTPGTVNRWSGCERGEILETGKERNAKQKST